MLLDPILYYEDLQQSPFIFVVMFGDYIHLISVVLIIVVV